MSFPIKESSAPVGSHIEPEEDEKMTRSNTKSKTNSIAEPDVDQENVLSMNLYMN